MLPRQHYFFMKYFFLFVVLIFSFKVKADGGSIMFDLEKSHDLVAFVRVDSINVDYRRAVNITVEEVIYKYGEVTNSNFMVDAEVGDTLILVESNISPILNNRDGSKTNRIESISSNSCYRFEDYKVGKKLRLFAKEIEKGFFKNNACTLTKFIE